MFKVLFTDRAKKDLFQLQSDTAKQIKQRLKYFSENPLNYAKKLEETTLGTFRFRVGDYRIIFDLVEDKIIILRIGHRKDIYK
ncbi:MAG: type II toxin-antitoxin system RelE/ParE family toxin [Ignavibacteriales bacterium]|nr:MAG: type II toxin-antitoxin system RelE/ParE family toxin [Ignavibacteriales bacterium]